MPSQVKYSKGIILNYEFSRSQPPHNTVSSTGDPFIHFETISYDYNNQKNDWYTIQHNAADKDGTNFTFFPQTSFSLDSGFILYITAKLLTQNTNIIFGLCGDLPYLQLVNNSLRAIIPTSVGKEDLLISGSVPTNVWLTIFLSVRSMGSNIEYSWGHLSQTAMKSINGILSDKQLLSGSAPGDKCYLMQNIQTNFSIRSFTYENEYQDTLNFTTKCSGTSLCVLLNMKYCVFAPTNSAEFWKYNVNSQSQCICERGECITCQQNYYYNAITNICEKCNILCADCTTGDNTHCTKCNSTVPYVQYSLPGTCDCKLPYIWNSTLAKCVCPSHTYLLNLDCVECNFMCDQCIGEGNDNCVGCSTVEGINKESNGICSVSDGYYKIPNTNTISKCHPSCSKCDGLSSEDCISCSLGFTLNILTGFCVCDVLNNFEYNENLGKCLCKSHYYLSEGSCEICDRECANCSVDHNSTVCHACMPGLKMKNGVCYCEVLFAYDGVSKCKIKTSSLVMITVLGAVGIAGIALLTICLVKHFRNVKAALRTTQTSDP